MIKQFFLSLPITSFTASSVLSDGAETLPTLEAGTLTLCLPRNSGVLAGKRAQGGFGFEYEIGKLLAAELSLELKPMWFEHELEEESDPVRATYAMLAYPLCDLVSGQPLYKRAMGVPVFERASMPRWVGMPQEIDLDTGHRKNILAGFVDVKPIDVSLAYIRAGVGLVKRKGLRDPANFHDLGDAILGFQQGSLSGAIAMVNLRPAELRSARQFNPGASFLWEVEKNKLAYALTDLTAFDSYRKSNLLTEYELSTWQHRFGLDIGFAVLESNHALKEAVNSVLQRPDVKNQLPELAKSVGLSFVAPTGEGIAPDFTMEMLRE